MAKLEKYRLKPDSKRSHEPAEKIQKGAGDAKRYVMHKHAASHDHFDLRLEQDGVLLSWALPKGPSLEAGEKRLAVQVEDHPLDYADFEGVIPAKSYGGGTVMVWDRGYWKVGKQQRDRIEFELEGEKLKGAWILVRMAGKQKNGKHWLLIKRSDDTQRMASDISVEDNRSVLSGRNMVQIGEQGNT